MALVFVCLTFCSAHGSPPWWGVSLAEHGRRTRRCRQLRLVGRGYVEVGIDIPVRFRRGGQTGDQPACFVVHRPVLDCCRRGGGACGSRARLWRGPGGRGGRACLLLRGAAEALLLWRQAGVSRKVEAPLGDPSRDGACRPDEACPLAGLSSTSALRVARGAILRDEVQPRHRGPSPSRGLCCVHNLLPITCDSQM